MVYVPGVMAELELDPEDASPPIHMKPESYKVPVAVQPLVSSGFSSANSKLDSTSPGGLERFMYRTCSGTTNRLRHRPGV